MNLPESLTQFLKSSQIPQVILVESDHSEIVQQFAQSLFIQLDPTVNQSKLTKGIHPDFKKLSIDPKTQLYLISQTREWLKELRMHPYEAQLQLFLVFDIDKMSPLTANTLLKSLEEPLLDTYIILHTKNKHKILPTILSRCICLTVTESISPITDAFSDLYQTLIHSLVRGNLHQGLMVVDQLFHLIDQKLCHEADVIDRLVSSLREQLKQELHMLSIEYYLWLLKELNLIQVNREWHIRLKGSLQKLVWTNHTKMEALIKISL